MKEAIDKTGQGQANEILDSPNSKVSSMSESIPVMIMPHHCQGVSQEPNVACRTRMVAAFHISIAEVIGN